MRNKKAKQERKQTEAERANAAVTFRRWRASRVRIGLPQLATPGTHFGDSSSPPPPPSRSTLSRNPPTRTVPTCTLSAAAALGAPCFRITPLLHATQAGTGELELRKVEQVPVFRGPFGRPRGRGGQHPHRHGGEGRRCVPRSVVPLDLLAVGRSTVVGEGKGDTAYDVKITFPLLSALEWSLVLVGFARGGVETRGRGGVEHGLLEITCLREWLRVVLSRVVMLTCSIPWGRSRGWDGRG